MIQTYLVNILLFSAILLLLTLTIGAVQIVLILLDLRKTATELKKKLEVFTSMLDIATLLFGGLNSAKRRVASKFSANGSVLLAFVAGFKKALKILFNKKGDDCDAEEVI